MEWHKRLAGNIWRKLPQSVRRILVRSTQNKFTVSVSAVVLNDEGKILLLDHVLRPKYGWGTPGGFIELSEQPSDAIRRELLEETGLELRDVTLVSARTFISHVEIIFRARASGEPRIQSSEIHSGGWFDLDAMPGQMSDAQKFVIRKTLS
jgi:ADP-ribose pyrophosphatase YjhB (NUDIX family)